MIPPLPVALTAAVAAAVAGLVAITTAPADVRVEVRAGRLRVRLGRRDKLAALHGDLDLPVGAVLAVRALPTCDVPRTGLRSPGTSLPGRVRAGSYGLGAARQLWDVRRAERLLVLDLRPGQAYRRLVLEVPDPDAEAARLTALLDAPG